MLYKLCTLMLLGVKALKLIRKIYSVYSRQHSSRKSQLYDILVILTSGILYKIPGITTDLSSGHTLFERLFFNIRLITVWNYVYINGCFIIIFSKCLKKYAISLFATNCLLNVIVFWNLMKFYSINELN